MQTHLKSVKQNVAVIWLWFFLSIMTPGIQSQTTSPGIHFKLGMAGYTFKELSTDQTLDILKKMDIHFMSAKDFQLPPKSTDEQLQSILKKYKDAGVTIYTVGVVYMATPSQIDSAFIYAQKAGVQMIVADIPYDLLKNVEKKVIETNIRIAIHNHGPEGRYPAPADIWNRIKDLDPRMGICIDIGHTTRNGNDPSEEILKYKSRIFDIHIKDVDKGIKEGKTIEMGRGIIDIPKFIKTLIQIDYTGVCSLEFEKDMKDPLAGIAESLGYFKGVLACQKEKL